MKKFILGVLVFGVVLTGLFLAALNLLSGTGESQKRALEQAVSGAFQGQANLGELTKFTVFPHLTIATKKLTVTSTQRGNIAADETEISFGFFDILFNRSTIERFRLTNFTVSGAGYLPQPLSIDRAEIVAGGADAAQSPHFGAQGTYGGQPLRITFDMEEVAGVPPRYRFREETPFTIDIGLLRVSGVFSPRSGAGTEFRQLKVFGPKNRAICDVAPEKTIAARPFFQNMINNPGDLCKK